VDNLLLVVLLFNFNNFLVDSTSSILHVFI